MEIAGFEITIERKLKSKVRKRFAVNIKGESTFHPYYSPKVNMSCELFEGSDGTLGMRTLYTYPINHIRTVSEVLGEYEDGILEMIKNFGEKEDDKETG